MQQQVLSQYSLMMRYKEIENKCKSVNYMYELLVIPDIFGISLIYMISM